MIQIKITDEQRENLLCSAIEGGSNYWYEIPDETVRIARQFGTNDEPLVTKMWRAIKAGQELSITDRENEDEVLGKISLKSIEEGEQLMADKYSWHLADILNDNEDAETGDVWFQLAVMKDVVFG